MDEEEPNLWQRARYLHILEKHHEVFMIDCGHWRCMIACAWNERQEHIRQANECTHPGRKRAMLRQLEVNKDGFTD